MHLVTATENGMCVKPNVIPEVGPVACHRCWQCTENAINDWAGRCIAESKHSVACHAVTLTYGPDATGNEFHERAAVLTYSDVQKFWKRLRNNGYPFRYVVAGEYGTLKGRSHWHAIIFWKKEVPEFKLCKREDFDLWGHGWAYWEKPSFRSIRYVCKYIQKDLKDQYRQGHFAPSKKPPIGNDFFMALAEQYVKEGKAPQDRYYRHPEAKKKNGKPVEFYLTGKSFDNFMTHYVDQWGRRWPERKWMPASELLEEWLDKRAEIQNERDAYERQVAEYDERIKREADRKQSKAEKEDLIKAHDEYYFGWSGIGRFETEWSMDYVEEQATAERYKKEWLTNSGPLAFKAPEPEGIEALEWG